MARYIRDEVLNQPEDFVQFMMNDFLTKHGFKQVNFKGQQVYRAGGGWFEMPKFLIWSYQGGVFHLEAWARYLILPGVYSREKHLDGFYGAVVKKVYKHDLEQLIALLHQPPADAAERRAGRRAGHRHHKVCQHGAGIRHCRARLKLAHLGDGCAQRHGHHLCEKRGDLKQKGTGDRRHGVRDCRTGHYGRRVCFESYGGGDAVLKGRTEQQYEFLYCDPFSGDGNAGTWHQHHRAGSQRE